MAIRRIRVVRGLKGWPLSLLFDLDVVFPGGASIGTRLLPDLALFAKEALKQLVRLSAFDLVICCEADNELIGVLRELFQLDLLLGRSQSEPSFGFSLMPFSNRFGDS